MSNTAFIARRGKIFITNTSGKKSVWNKTRLNTGCVGGTWVDPPTCKMNLFFLWSLARSMQIYRNFQSNGAKLRLCI